MASSNGKKHLITIQNVDEELWARVKSFLETHRRIPSISALSKVSLESYLDLAGKYGIDLDWKLKIPEPPKEQVRHDTD